MGVNVPPYTHRVSVQFPKGILEGLQICPFDDLYTWLAFDSLPPFQSQDSRSAPPLPKYPLKFLTQSPKLLLR